jgi:NifU-like protein involved in Fe-S cluster formation
VIEDSLQREILEDHARNPRFDDDLPVHTHQAEFQSLKTGNTCTIRINVQDGLIEGIGLEVQGSALANAGASLLVSEIIEFSVDQVKDLISNLGRVLELDESPDLPGDLVVYHSIKRFPERHDCALLAWRALAKALPF